MKKRRRVIKVRYKKLISKHKVYGLAYTDKDLIEIDESLKGKKHLEILIHESIHILFPDMEEREVIEKSIIVTNTVWKECYRRVDLSNKIKLQDGSK